MRITAASQWTIAQEPNTMFALEKKDDMLKIAYLTFLGFQTQLDYLIMLPFGHLGKIPTLTKSI